MHGWERLHFSEASGDNMALLVLPEGWKVSPEVHRACGWWIRLLLSPTDLTSGDRLGPFCFLCDRDCASLWKTGSQGPKLRGSVTGELVLPAWTGLLCWKPCPVMKTKEDSRSALKIGCLVDSQGSSMKPELLPCCSSCGVALTVPLLSSKTPSVFLLPARDIMPLRETSPSSPGKPATTPGLPPNSALVESLLSLVWVDDFPWLTVPTLLDPAHHVRPPSAGNSSFIPPNTPTLSHLMLKTLPKSLL